VAMDTLTWQKNARKTLTVLAVNAIIVYAFSQTKSQRAGHAILSRGAFLHFFLPVLPPVSNGGFLMKQETVAAHVAALPQVEKREVLVINVAMDTLTRENNAKVALTALAVNAIIVYVVQ